MMQFSRFLILFIGVFSTSFVHAQNEPSPVATAAIDAMVDGHYGKCYSLFSKKIKKSLPKRYLKLAWKGLKRQHGELQKIGDPTVNNTNGATTHTYPFQYEKAQLNLHIVVSEKNEITGFRFATEEYAIPDWAENKSFGKERITIKTDTFKLPGELLVPPDCNQCPVVVLVHGSGPSDRDGSVGPNKVLLDFAYGLALRGIASIRYDKRTMVYGGSFKDSDSITVKQETIEDALSAVELARSYDFIDSDRIYVLGHSLGAYVAPRIAKADSSIAGIVMVAGPTRPLHEIMPEQFEYLFTLDSSLNLREKKILQLAEQEQLLIEGKPSKAKKLRVLGTPNLLPYFRDFLDYDPVETVRNLDCDVLIMQGDRDYQVRYETEFKKYQEDLSNEDHVDFYLLEGGNHLMIKGEGPSTPSEYMAPSHVEIDCFEAIENWIEKGSR